MYRVSGDKENREFTRNLVLPEKTPENCRKFEKRFVTFQKRFSEFVNTYRKFLFIIIVIEK